MIHHHKYGNNYDYNRTVYLMNQVPFLDNNVFMLKEDDGVHAPLSVIYYEFYEEKDLILDKLKGMRNELLAVFYLFRIKGENFQSLDQQKKVALHNLSQTTTINFNADKLTKKDFLPFSDNYFFRCKAIHLYKAL